MVITFGIGPLGGTEPNILAVPSREVYPRLDPSGPETMIERIDPPKEGGPPFSGLVVAGPFVFVAGQVGTDPKTGATPAGFRAQTQNVLSNIEAKLSKAGCSLKDVVKATVFLSDIRGFGEMNDVYRTAFAPDFPARSTIEAHLARPELLVEIEVVAFRPEGKGKF